MVLKQGEGYKPRGKTGVTVGTSKVQLHLPPEAGPARPEQGSRRMLPWAWGQCSMVPSQGAALLQLRVRRSWQLASKAPLENTCKSSPSGSIAPSGGFEPHCSPSSSQPVWILSQIWPVGKPQWHCPALPRACWWRGLHPGETTFQQVHELHNIRQAWADGTEPHIIPLQKKHFYYQAWSAWSLNICCSLLGAADRGITGGLWFATFVFIYICVSRKVAIRQIWKCLIRSDGQIN